MQLEDSIKVGHVEVSPSEKLENQSLVELWVLADKLCMPCLQNVTLKAINDISEKLIRVDILSIEYLYKQTATGSPLRRYWLANCASMGASAFTITPEKYPHEMLMNFAEYMIRRERGAEKKFVDISDYFAKED